MGRVASGSTWLSAHRQQSLDRLGRIIQELRPQRVTIQFETGGAGGRRGVRRPQCRDWPKSLKFLRIARAGPPDLGAG